jgi:hypothetical protein
VLTFYYRILHAKSQTSPLKQYSKTSQNKSQGMETILLLMAGLGRSGNVPFTIIADRSKFVCSVICASV